MIVLNILLYVLIACGIITAISVVIVIVELFIQYCKGEKLEWEMFIGAFAVVPVGIFMAIKELSNYLSGVHKAGGFSEYHRKKKEKKEAEKRKREEEERITLAYKNGELKREEHPRLLDGIKKFEFNIPFDMYNKLLYIENGYNETFNSFFKRHGCIEFKQDIRVIYLPEYMLHLVEQDMLGYFAPWVKDGENQKFSAKDVMKFIFSQLSYPEDAKKLQHGILLFDIGFQYNKYGMEVFPADYHPLEEGDDDFIMSQLTRIAESLYRENQGPIHYHLGDAPQEGVSDDFADYEFLKTIYNNEISILVKEVRERVIKLHQFGISENLILKMIKTPPMLSRLVITKDYHIMLPDYGNIEIKMEPLNKAVFLLFLRHKEGIIFKHLPDYEQELLEIYAKLKPMGINDKVRKSISDVCNPCKNSINEKCARIRGAFISHFDEYLAKNYYVTGYSGQPKGIKLPRKLITWEEDYVKLAEELEQSSPFGVMRKTTFEDIAMTKSAIIDYFTDKYPKITPVWNNIEAEVCNISFSVNGKNFNALIEIWDEINELGCRYVTETEYKKLLEYSKTNGSTPCFIAVTPPYSNNGKKQNKVIQISNGITAKAIDFSEI